jgi:hypothetical protein
MKKLTIILFYSLAILFLLLLLNSNSKAQQDNINKNHFYIGAQGNIFPEYFPQFQELSFNTYLDWGTSEDFQKYYSWQNGYDRIYGGFYDTVVGPSPPYNPYPPNERLPDGYRVGEQYFLGKWHDIMNSSDAGSVFLGSARVYRSCMGQRSTYQVEDNSYWIAQTPGYGYEQTDMVNADYTDVWKGETQRVKYCQVGVQNAGYIAKKLFENGEQADVISRSETAMLYSDQKRIGDNFHWYVKPRMRIDSNFANNPDNWDTKVVKVEVYNYAGRLLIPTVDIKVIDFLDANLHYDGKYIENLPNRQDIPNKLSVLSDSLVAGADSLKYYSDPNLSNIDYRVYWYGEVDVMLDYVRLDDEWAHFLFTDLMGTLPFSINRYQFARRMHDEAANLINTGGLAYFYQDEFYWNHIPCISETNRLIKSWLPNSGIIVMTSYSPGLKHKPTAEQLYDRLKAEGLYDNFVAIDKYPIYYNTLMPPNLHVQDSIRQTYAAISYPGAYQNASNSTEYNHNLNESVYEQDYYRDDYQRAADVIKTSATNTAFISTIQTDSWEDNFLRIDCGQSIEGWEFRREPTNEEISLQDYFSMCYGAKHLHYFMQWSGMGIRACDNTKYCNNGLTAWWGQPGTNEKAPRYINYYGEHKWNFIASLDSNLMKIGRYMYDRDSLKYDATISVHKDGFGSGYISNLKSYYRNPTAPFDFSPGNEDQVKYWEIGYFKDNSNAFNKYFMLLNMRCVPEISGGDGDLRTVKLYLDPNQLPTFNTWVIKEVISGQAVTFDKNNITNGVSLPVVFQPGEGKLFKLAPVMQEGGTLLTDENFAGVNLDCIGVVNNNGHNITIGLSTTLNFNDTAKIFMDGGTFTCGNYLQPNGPRNVHFRSSYAGWDGLEFNCCSVVNISNAVFENIAPSTKVDSINYAVKLLGCFVYNISNNTFTNLNGYSSGAINSSFYGDVVHEVVNPYITHNTFDMNTSNRMIVKVQTYAANTVPVFIDGNIFTSEASSSQAIYLTSITGGAVRNNSINGFNAGINSLETSIDFFQNDISSSLPNSYGIYGCANSTLKMSTNGPLVMAGYNQLSNTGYTANNLNVENSYFLIDNGNNIFNISLQEQGKHLYGYFPADEPADVYAANNCFKDNGSVTTPVHDVTWGAGGGQVNFIFTPYLPNCMPGDQGSDMIISLGNGAYDTIFVRGSGGGMRGVFIITAKSLYDSICIDTRKRNYGSVRSKSTDMLNMFPDSIQSLDAISKLYLGTRMTDTSSASFNALKTYYENLILNHPSNIPLVKKCNYMVQKCKVQLRQYSSAMAGFQQIINENPYSYEGLVAKWDYMATHLLDSIGYGGGEAPPNLPEGEGSDDPHDKFTKEQRQVIKTSIGTALQDSKIKEEKKIEILTGLAGLGDLGAAKILEQKRVLQNIIKIEHPHNILEHIRIVNSDIRKLYGQSRDDIGKKQNIVPSVFRLSQNYPNPFNPVTKIQYDLPKDVKVKLIIYDILGREVIRLVNNEFKQAGRYTVEFNGNNYASGVYFYRIEAGDPSSRSGQGFVQSKKMVLIK